LRKCRRSQPQQSQNRGPHRRTNQSM